MWNIQKLIEALYSTDINEDVTTDKSINDVDIDTDNIISQLSSTLNKTSKSKIDRLLSKHKKKPNKKPKEKDEKKTVKKKDYDYIRDVLKSIDPELSKRFDKKSSELNIKPIHANRKLYRDFDVDLTGTGKEKKDDAKDKSFDIDFADLEDQDDVVSHIKIQPLKPLKIKEDKDDKEDVVEDPVTEINRVLKLFNVKSESIDKYLDSLDNADSIPSIIELILNIETMLSKVDLDESDIRSFINNIIDKKIGLDQLKNVHDNLSKKLGDEDDEDEDDEDEDDEDEDEDGKKRKVRKVVDINKTMINSVLTTAERLKNYDEGTFHNTLGNRLYDFLSDDPGHINLRRYIAGLEDTRRGLLKVFHKDDHRMVLLKNVISLLDNALIRK